VGARLIDEAVAAGVGVAGAGVETTVGGSAVAVGGATDAVSADCVGACVWLAVPVCVGVSSDTWSVGVANTLTTVALGIITGPDSGAGAQAISADSRHSGATVATESLNEV